MLSSAAPLRLPKPFAAGAGGGFIRPIPTASQIGIQNGAASLTDGFPPLTMTPLGSGGVPPFGQDTNGLLNWLSSINQWYQLGGPLVYDATFATAIGGYPKGSVLQAAGLAGGFWRCTADGNLTDPDGGSAANWVSLFAPVFASPTFTGTMTASGPAVFNSTVGLGGSATATTQGQGDGSTHVATTAYVDTAKAAANTFATAAAAAAQAAAISTAEGYAAAVAGTAQTNAINASEAYSRSLVDGFSIPQGNSAIQNSGGGGSLTPSFTFNAPVAGVLWAWGSRNLSAQDASANLGQLLINGGVVAGDNTRDSMSHGWCAVVGPGTYSVEYSASALVAYSASVGFLYVPYPPVY